MLIIGNRLPLRTHLKSKLNVLENFEAQGAAKDSTVTVNLTFRYKAIRHFSTIENHGSLGACVAELFNIQPSALHSEMDCSFNFNFNITGLGSFLLHP